MFFGCMPSGQRLRLHKRDTANCRKWQLVRPFADAAWLDINGSRRFNDAAKIGKNEMFIHDHIIGTPTTKTQGIPTIENGRLAYMNTLSDRLIRTLAEIDKNQSELARYVGVRSPSVNDWISGKTKTIKGSNLIRASEFLGVNPLWLAEGKGPKHPLQPGATLPPSGEVANESAAPAQTEPAKGVAQTLAMSTPNSKREVLDIARSPEIESIHAAINKIADTGMLDANAVAAITAVLQLIESKNNK